MPVTQIVKSSAFAWTIAGMAIFSALAVATYAPRKQKGTMALLKLTPSSADKFAGVKSHPLYSPALLVARSPKFLSSSDIKSNLKAKGLPPAGSNSLTLTPSQTSQTLPGSSPPTAFLCITGAINSPLGSGGWFEIEAPELSNQPVGLGVNFLPTSAQQPYIVEVDFNALGGAENVMISQLSGPTASVPIGGTGHSAQVAVIPNGSNWVILNIYPDHGYLAISAIKITGF
jgi:hypothetical protein